MASEKEIKRKRTITRSRGVDRERHLITHDRDFNKTFKYANNYVRTSKYTLLTFLPKNLFEQFKRLANFYFLILMILQWCPLITSLTPYTTIFPLVFVLTVSASKDAYDDIQRHISDRKVNNRSSTLVRDGTTIQEKWQKVQVGDVIRMENGDFVAADILLLSTSEPDGYCYIETAELDGETNLKARQALSETAELGDDLKSITNFRGAITFTAPSNLLPPVPEAFEGHLECDGRQYSLGNDQMLLRGCVLRNTRWCYGVVVFAGRETKLMMNSGRAHFKRTSLDGFINVLIIGIIVFLLAMCLICACLCALWEFVYGKNMETYLPRNTRYQSAVEDSVGLVMLIGFLVFFSYIILLNTLVPISLYVSVEIIRLFHSLLINWDKEMYYEKTKTYALARTTTLNEELGQIQYVFSDKTGTLTQNIMTFNKCSINGEMYGDVLDEMGNVIEPAELDPIDLCAWNEYGEEKFRWYDQSLLDATRHQEPVQKFWLLLALCHTVMPEWKDIDGENDNVDDAKLEYQAQSPDEAALVGAARNFGYVFKSRNQNSITIEIFREGDQETSREETYELLSILEFDNVRKRMSVLLRKDDTTILFCKGADNVIFERLATNRNQDELKHVTQSHLDAFAADGLRTLCLAYKLVDSAYCDRWLEKYREASTSLENRKELQCRLYEEIERDMTLIGATAIEDKLQDGVPKTIANLAKAKIKIWVLTGDKQETAVNIGYSSRLLTDRMRNVFVVNSATCDGVRESLDDAKAELRSYEESLRPKEIVAPTTSRHHHLDGAGAGGLTSRPSFISSIFYDMAESEDVGNALVITGQSLVHALKPEMEKLFLKVARQCTAVICCRVTPSQKSMVVDLVKKHEKAVTLAIGDGANDVPMIKSAHIGVGISGQEGMQAVLSSDYSIAQFRFLERLLLVHGRWSYFRMSKFMKYFFYKNFAFTLVQFWYAFYCGYSAQSLFDAFFITCYNLIFTSLPVLAVGILDQDVDDKNSIKYPLLYTPGPANKFFNMRVFGISLLHGIYTSIVLFFVTHLSSGNAIDNAGIGVDDIWTFGFKIVSALVVSVTGQIALDTSHWTVLHFISIFLSLAGLFFFAIGYYELLPYVKLILQSGYGSAFVSMRTATYWFDIALIGALTLLPVVAIRYFYYVTQPTMTDRVRARQRLERGGVVLDDESFEDSALPRSISIQQQQQQRQPRTARTSQRTISSSVFAPSPPTMHRVATSATTGPGMAGATRPAYMGHRKQWSAFSMPAEPGSNTTAWENLRRGSRVRTESIRSGYAFSHEHGFGERITSGVLRMHSSREDVGRRRMERRQKYDTIAATPRDASASKKSRSVLNSDGAVQVQRF